jgi:Outer membrane protein beta-barrel domain
VLRPISQVSLFTLILVSAAGPLAAQRISISPTIGVYIPTSELVKAANGQEFKQEIALAVGGRLGINFTPRLGLVTSVSYVPSNLRFTFNQNETKTDANLLFGSARASYQLIPYTSPVWLGLNAGASLIKRGGDAYADAEDKTDVGGVVGATIGFRLGSLLSFYVAADDYIYGTTFADASTLEEKKTQNDVQLSVGFGVPLNR